jgi:basic membrane protein A
VPNLASFVQKKCNLIIAVGGLMNKATAQASTANPTFHFAEVDAPSAAANMYGMQFNTAQGAFLAGYLAAGMTKTGKVAEFGGLPISPVTVYMDGFWEGVQYYNAHKGTHVQVLGWNEHNPSGGSIVGGPNAFIDQSAGKRVATNFIQQGADIIFPVAGGTGLGAAAAAQQSGGKVSIIWVDFDGCFSVPQYCSVFLTSVYKSITPAVRDAVDSAARGNFLTGNYLGTLANNGTGLSPFHDFASKVPASLQSELAQLKAQIIAGKITITSPNQPKA